MSEKDISSGIVRFGVFQADLRTGELHKNGIEVTASGATLPSFCHSAGSTGELASREELRERVWPKDIFAYVTTRLIQQSPGFEWRWMITPTSRVSSRLSRVAVSVL